MNFLVVDDDPVICSGTIRRILAMNDARISRVDGAYSGEEALEKMRSGSYDALVTDIRMDGISGLELMEQSRKINPELICLVVTAYDWFEYARQALRLGVVDYLIKPCSEQDMQNHIREMIRYWQRTCGGREQRLEEAVFSCLQGIGSNLRACFQRFGRTIPQEKTDILVWERPLLTMPSAPEGCWVYAPAGQCFALWQGPREELMEWAQWIVKNSEQSVGVSLNGKSPDEAFSQACKALENNWYSTKSMIYEASEEAENELPAQIGDAILKMDAEAFRKQVSMLLQGENEKPLTPWQAERMLKSCAGRMEEMAKSAGWEDEGSLLQLRPCMGWVQAVRELTETLGAFRERMAINSEEYRAVYAREYVKEHLGEQIDMAVVANELNLSYAYFSRMFRRQTGKTFARYVLEARLQEACRQMLAGEKISDIAQRLGYQNANNLSRAFTNEFGKSPKQWMKEREM